MGSQGLNLGWPSARQMPYPLCYYVDPDVSHTVVVVVISQGLLLSLLQESLLAVLRGSHRVVILSQLHSRPMPCLLFYCSGPWCLIVKSFCSGYCGSWTLVAVDIFPEGFILGQRYLGFKSHGKVSSVKCRQAYLAHA